MNVKRQCLKEKLNKDIKDAVSRHLYKSYQSLSEDLKKKYLVEFNLKDIKSVAERRADLFLIDENNFNFYYFSEKYDYLEIGAFSLTDKVSGKFEEFKEEIKKIITAKSHAKPNFEGIEESPHFNYIKEEMNEFELDPRQINIAAELRDEFIRNLINRIGNGVWLSEFIDTDKIVMETSLQKLESYDLIKREYVVFCHETGAQIIRVNNYNAIEESHKRGFKCFSCGRMLSEERTDHFITLTESGKLFAKKNFWAGFIIAAYLYDHLKKDLKIFYREEVDKESLDLIINYQSKLILLQIKQDKIDLADLYYFISKKRFYNVDFGCVFSLVEPDPSVRYFLNHKNSENIELYTRWEDLFNNIPALLNKACGRNIMDMVNIFSENTRIDIMDYLREYLKEPAVKAEKEKVFAEEKAEEKESIAPVIKEKIVIEEKAETKQEEKPKKKPRQAEAAPAAAESGYAKTITAAESLAGDISKCGILNLKDDAEKILREISAPGLFSSALIDEASGFYIYDFMAPEFKKEEEVGAYFAEVFSQAKDISEKLSFPPVNMLRFEGSGEVVYLYNAGGCVLLLMEKDSKTRASSPQDKKALSSFEVNLSGEMTVSDTSKTIDCGAIKEFIFNVYNMAKQFISKTGMEKIEKIAVKNKDYEITATFEPDKINFVIT